MHSRKVLRFVRTPLTDYQFRSSPSDDQSPKNELEQEALRVESVSDANPSSQTGHREEAEVAAETLPVEEELDEDVRDARASIKVHLERMRETENFLKSLRAEEESFEQRRQQLSMMGDLAILSNFAPRTRSITVLDSSNSLSKGSESAPVAFTQTNRFLPPVLPPAMFRRESSYKTPTWTPPIYEPQEEPSLGIGFRPPSLSRTGDSWRSMRSRSQLSDRFSDYKSSRRPLSTSLSIQSQDVYLPSRTRRSTSLLRGQPERVQLGSNFLGLARATSPARSCESSDGGETSTSYKARSNIPPGDDEDDDDGMSAYRVSSYVPKIQPDLGIARGRPPRRKLAESLDSNRDASPLSPVAARSPARNKRSLSIGRDHLASSSAQQVNERRLSLSSGETENSRLSELERRLQANKQRREELLASSMGYRGRQASLGNETQQSEAAELGRKQDSTPSEIREPLTAKLARPSRLESMEARIKRRSYCTRMTSPEKKRKPAQAASGRLNSPRGSLAEISFTRSNSKDMRSADQS